MPRPAADATLVQARILDATESQLRRYGPEKLTVGDIAKEVGMSHPNLYRFFPGKGAMLQAVTNRWLEAVLTELRGIAERPDPATDRLEAFFIALHRNKLRKVTSDPELFKVYATLIAGGCGSMAHCISTIGSIGRGIMQDGVRLGEFPADTDIPRAGSALRDACIAYIDARFVEATVAEGDAEARLATIVRVVLAGVAAGVCRITDM